VLSLKSSRWSELEHAYGSAADVPRLLAQLAALPPSGGDSEPWYPLWSALAHQGSVFSASFAAAPHVVAALASAPDRATFDYLQFPAWVEVCRLRTGVPVPEDLAASYFESLARLPSLVAAASQQLRDPGFLACALSAVAASAGQASIAEAALELTSEAEANAYLEGKFA